VLEVSDSPSALGIVLAARLIPTVVLLLAGGVVADRMSRRTVMVAADLVRLLSHAAMAALLLGDAAEVWSLAVLSIWPLAWSLLAIPAATGWIAAAAFLGGIGLMVFNALWEATLQAEIPAASLSRVSAYDWLGSLALNPLGTALVGVVAAGIGVRTTLLACAVLITIVNAAMLLIPGVRHTRAVAPV
jgi:MFS family permease